MKGKPPKEIRERRGQQPRREQVSIQPPKPFLKKLEWILGIGVGITGLLLTALQYQARPTVSLGTPLDPSDVMTTPITISNDGLTDLKDMRFQSFFKNIQFRDVRIGDEIGTRLLDKIDTFAPGEKQEILPYQAIGIPSQYGTPIELDFALVVSFRPAYWPFDKRRFFRFSIAHNSDGTARLRNIAANDIKRIYDDTVRRMKDGTPTEHQ
jgi:hypothetical protein